MSQIDVRSMLDHASVQSDRWLMIALLFAMLAGAAWLVRMVLGSMMVQMKVIVDDLKHDQIRLVTVVDANTKAFAQQTETLRDQSDAFRGLERQVALCQRTKNGT